MVYIEIGDPTLNAADKALESNKNKKKFSPYLGFGEIGNYCKRKIFYSFRWFKVPFFSATALKLFEDGNIGEMVMAERLRAVDGLELETIDPTTNYQYGFTTLGGHFKGFTDGFITGILQAPKTKHVWENKVASDKKFKELNKLKGKLDEKQVLHHWSMTYYCQAVLYMFFSGLNRHYMTVSTPGSRESTSIRTNANDEVAKALINKAESIIFSNTIPWRYSDNPDDMECKFCDYKMICHYSGSVVKNCRTCVFSDADRSGDWVCNNDMVGKNTVLSLEDQKKGCPYYIRLTDQWMGGNIDEIGKDK
ncbi:MAG: hypothetical protein ABFD50_07905 [Smithella sp.]